MGAGESGVGPRLTEHTCVRGGEGCIRGIEVSFSIRPNSKRVRTLISIAATCSRRHFYFPADIVVRLICSLALSSLPVYVARRPPAPFCGLRKLSEPAETPSDSIGV
jgi:hypothetical protein